MSSCNKTLNRKEAEAQVCGHHTSLCMNRILRGSDSCSHSGLKASTKKVAIKTGFLSKDEIGKEDHNPRRAAALESSVLGTQAHPGSRERNDAQGLNAE